ncbi:hypothetical protein X734_04140 [Mesorhizobium sp. L2C084A000]|nr:hypothetical protein X734_04140 [Mesorhizobium sp. L2C084A000]
MRIFLLLHFVAASAMALAAAEPVCQQIQVPWENPTGRDQVRAAQTPVPDPAWEVMT